MDKETLLSKFKPSMGEPNATSQMYENIGISVRTLDTYLDKILPSIADDANVTEDFIKGHVDFLKAIGGQLRHEKSEFIKSYNPEQKEKEKSKQNEESNNEYEDLKKSILELQNQISGQEKQKSIDMMKQSVKDKAKALKVQNQALFNDVVNSIQVTEGMNEESLESAVKSAYESKLKAYFGEGAEPYGGNKSAGGSGNEELYKQRREMFRQRMKSQGRLP